MSILGARAIDEKNGNYSNEMELHPPGINRMSELSAAEKRKLLREKRAAKMGQTSSNRLNKIVNSTGSTVHELSATTDSTPKSASPVDASDDLDDIPVPSIHDIPQPSLRSGVPRSADSVDDILSSLIQNHQQSPPHSNAGSSSGPLPNDFMNTIGSFLEKNGNGEIPQPPQAPVSAEDSLIKTQTAGAFALLRYVIVSIVFCFTCLNDDSCFASQKQPSFHVVSRGFFSNWFSVSNVLDLSPCSLWRTFLIVECSFSILQLVLANNKKIPQRSKDSWMAMVLGFIPMKYKEPLTIAIDYFDVVMSIWKDLCLIIVLLIAKSYIV